MLDDNEEFRHRFIQTVNAYFNVIHSGFKTLLVGKGDCSNIVGKNCIQENNRLFPKGTLEAAFSAQFLMKVSFLAFAKKAMNSVSADEWMIID